jgi:hypothetical protein
MRRIIPKPNVVLWFPNAKVLPDGTKIARVLEVL